MSAYSIPPLVSSILFFLLGLFCYLKNKKSKVNISFALMCLTTVWWQGSWAVLFNVKDPSIASILVRFGYIGITFIPITFYHFTIEFLNRQEEKKLVWISYLIGAFLVIMLWATDLYIRGYYVFYWGYYPKAGLLFHPIYLAMLSIQALRMLYLLYINLKNKLLDPIKLNQIKYMFWAIFFYTFASVDFADNYGLEIYPLGFIPILIFMAIIGHTIAKYRLLDINFVIRKIIAYTGVILLLAGFVAGIYLLPLSEYIKLLLYFVTASVFAIISPKIITKTESAVNNILYKGKYDYIEKLESFIDRMVIIPKEEDLLKQTVQSLSETIGVKKVALFTFDIVLGDYNLQTQVGLSGVKDFRIPGDAGISAWLKKHREIFIKEEKGKILEKTELLSIKDTLDKLSATICIPVMFETDLLGIIVLGEKESGEMYSHLDTGILRRLGIQLAVALEYKRVEAELRKKQEYAAIGQLAFEITHEMKNLLAPINTFLQLLPERLNDSEFINTMSRFSKTNVDAINRKVEDILYFGQEKRLNLSAGLDINKLLSNTAEGLRPLAQKNNIPIIEELGDIPKIIADEELLLHVFNNLIINAIDAMKSRTGKIRIRTQRNIDPSIQMRQISPRWIRIEVKDDGGGIPDNIKDKLFMAFVTTKSGGGDLQKRGMGLGLTIVKKIVDQHHGIVGVNSSIGKGTTFVVDLPVEQRG